MLQGQIFKKPQWLQNLRAVKATPVKLFITSPYQSQLSFQLLISSLIYVPNLATYSLPYPSYPQAYMLC